MVSKIGQSHVRHAECENKASCYSSFTAEPNRNSRNLSKKAAQYKILSRFFIVYELAARHTSGNP